jgi:hypothetical protein
MFKSVRYLKENTVGKRVRGQMCAYLIIGFVTFTYRTFGVTVCGFEWQGLRVKGLIWNVIYFYG